MGHSFQRLKSYGGGYWLGRTYPDFISLARSYLYRYLRDYSTLWPLIRLRQKKYVFDDDF